MCAAALCMHAGMCMGRHERCECITTWRAGCSEPSAECWHLVQILVKLVVWCSWCISNSHRPTLTRVMVLHG